MVVSAELQRAIDMYGVMSKRAGETGTIEGMRAAYEEMMGQFKLADDVKIEKVSAGGVPAEWIVAPGAADDRVLLYFHAGGYAVGSLNTHRELISRFSRASSARALGLDYRLAPEHQFPAAVDDATAAYRWLLSSGVQPSKIVISGDSAGGGLTMATLVALRDAGDPMPAAAVPISPWVDLEITGESLVTRADVDPVAGREGLEYMRNLYIGDRDPRTPLVSPLYADLSGLPPLLIHVGDWEVLLNDATRLTDSARAAGVDVTLKVWEEMVHDWQQFPFMPEGNQSVGEIGQFIRDHTS